MKELFSVTLLMILFTINLVPFFIVFHYIFPDRMARTQANASAMPGRAFWIGMINFLFGLALVLVLFFLSDKTEGLLKAILTFPAVCIVLIFGIVLSFGLGSMAGLLGEQLVPQHNAWQRTVWGTLLLGCGSSVPLVGWFLLLPYVAWVGMGAFIIGLFQKTAL